MSELANNKSIRKEVNDLGETLGITPKGKNNQQKIRSIGEQASDGTYATKEYVNTLMSGALKRAIVETLPVEDIDTNTIYMVLDQSASQQGNVYNEYLYINNAWELIGTTATSGVEVINVAISQNITDEQFDAVLEHRAKFQFDDIELFYAGEDIEGHYVFTSTVYNGGYTQAVFTSHEDEVIYYTFEVETISIGGGIEYVTLSIHATTKTITQEQKTLLLNGAFIKDQYGSIYTPCSSYGSYGKTLELAHGEGNGIVVEIDFDNLTYTVTAYTVQVTINQ